MIYILTGEVHSGKTTALMLWQSEKSDVGGFLCPDIDGKRYLNNLWDKKQIEFQVDAQSPGVKVQVGPYLFAQEAFETAITWTLEHRNHSAINWIIIDEVGKLELKENGFHRLICQLVKNPMDKHYVFIIRDYLLEEAIAFYGLKDFRIIDVNRLSELNGN